MALTKCSECGREISDKAPACPSCGNPINKQDQAQQGQQKVVVIEQTSKTWKAIQLIFGLLFWVGIFMAFSHLGSKNEADIETMAMGNFFIGLGLIGWIVGKLGAWWNHR